MTIDQVTSILTGIRGRVTSETLDTIRKILVITQEYSFLGERFTFDASKDLSDQVNQLLIQLSDAMLEEADKRTLKTIENDDDDETVLAWIHREYNGESNEERMDKHSSALRFLLEGYLAGNLVNKRKLEMKAYLPCCMVCSKSFNYISSRLGNDSDICYQKSDYDD